MRLTVTPRPAARLVAAVALTAAAGVVGPAAPAAAATCSSGDGVTVVVDFHELGGGIQTACDTSGGGEAASRLFPDNGFPLTYVQRQPGFVCRVSGAPTADDESCVSTPPSDAYWGLWWSDGDSGSWSYSSEGAASLNVPDGGSVAFSWNDSNTKSPPGIAPPTHQAEQPSPTPQPSSPGGGSGGSGGGGSGGAGSGGGGPAGGGSGDGGSTPVPSATPLSPPAGSTAPGDADGNAGKHGKGAGKNDDDAGEGKGGRDDEGGRDGKGRNDEELSQPSEVASASTDAVPAAEPPAGAGADGVPRWVALAGIAGLFAVAGVVALIRRRSMS